jgi:hypothetical protein
MGEPVGRKPDVGLGVDLRPVGRIELSDVDAIRDELLEAASVDRGSEVEFVIARRDKLVSL